MIVILFILGCVYLVMCLVAYSHTNDRSMDKKLLAISPWWAIYSHIYDDFGKNIAKYGKIILGLELVGFVIWIGSKIYITK